MQDKIETLPTDNSSPNENHIQTIKTLFDIKDKKKPPQPVPCKTNYIAPLLIFIVISSDFVEDLLTKYLEFTANSRTSLLIVKTLLFGALLYIYNAYL